MDRAWLVSGALLIGIVSVAFGYRLGHDQGVNEQKVEDQEQFDEINAAITKQKGEAVAKLERAKDEILDLMTERETMKDELRKDRERARDKTDSLTRQLAFERLRFPAAEASGCGNGGGSPAAASAEAADPGRAPAGLVQLPEGIAADLRQLMAKADRLKDDYAECYGYAQQVR